MFLFGAIAWTIYGMYRSLSHAQSGLTKQNEGIDIARHSVDMQERSIEMQEKGLELAEQSLKKQDEIIRLLGYWDEHRGRFKSVQS
jgi:hypothetical protein